MPMVCQVQDNARYLAMVDHMLAADGYYFSTGYDITHTMQRLHNTSPEFQQMPLHERVSLSCPCQSVGSVWHWFTSFLSNAVWIGQL